MSKFLWGSATAAYQCEGAWNEDGKGLSNWDDFVHSERNNVNPVTGDVASDFYHRYEEDIKMMADGGQNAFRFSISWVRIFPNGTGEVNQKGIDFYNRVIDCCLKYEIEPLVTLYHYDLPLGIYNDGGWLNRNVVDAFVAYAKVCFDAFGDRVKYWMTINEPSYETLCCYGFGNYPPNDKNLSHRFQAIYHQLLASAKAVIEYKKTQDGMIGLVNDAYPIESLDSSPAYDEAIQNADWFYNTSVNDLAIKGEFPKGFVEKLKTSGFETDYIKEQDLPIFKAGVIDYLGLNAYFRYLVKPYETGGTRLNTNNKGDGKKEVMQVEGWFTIDEDPTTEKNPWGMEVYPKTMYDLLLDLKRQYPNTPIIITENGVGYYDDFKDNTVKDDYRIDYLKGFIEWMNKAQAEGCDVRGYLVWSTMDLYSWINGYKKRYGLVYVDYEDNNKRYPKESYYWYRDFIKNRGNN
ncbi:6-phospho-beta-glucosidase [Breznakia sp. PF5-3]|uniref:glycoside hydrolase family 1 protein n=1 Tax=unclassified Breznakia TaxID=2623764 RepID=UPI00240608F6|nr:MULTISPECIES: glycoside hydrolase family 1 protein [unclassified Breznakia]MDF9824523.1 6-phospho-beta-glucosidase [Breznakia sp. PM6-1]MDF9835309.1 6-phospho-beta-glucosidase [Breznakia sp. PF5-3]